MKTIYFQPRPPAVTLKIKIIIFVFCGKKLTVGYVHKHGHILLDISEIKLFEYQVNECK